jgi:CPA1 family monovalent cation:H+ antiporter
MQGVELVVILLAVSAALRLVARRLGVPHPVLLVLAGLALVFLPGLPRVEPDPDALFLLFIPPLLYWGALNTSLRDFRLHFWPIARYGTLVVLLTIVVVALVAHALTPEFPWAAAFTLGAIVSPPDPVAAIAVLRSIGARRVLTTILEGEGLVNDATALVAYRVAIGAAVTGSFSPGRAAVGFLVTGTGGVVIGLAVGWLIGWVRRRVRGYPIVENTISLLTPFFAYLPAEWLGLSGVLSVVAVGLYLGRLAPRLVPAATRIQLESMWVMVQFILESLVFILVGLELPYILPTLRTHSLGTLLRYGVLITATVIGVRLVYTFLAGAILRWSRRGRPQPTGPPEWRQIAFLGWAGMRGGDSLVIALAVPVATAAGQPFPARGLIIFLTFVVILATLVLQGPTLAPIIRWWGLTEGGQRQTEEAHARRVVAEAGLRRLQAEAGRDGVDRAVARYMEASYRRAVQRWSARDRERHGLEDEDHAKLAGVDGGNAERLAVAYRALRAAMIEDEREALVRLRDQGVIGDDVLRRVQRDLDLETVLLESAADDAPQSPYEVE